MKNSIAFDVNATIVDRFHQGLENHPDALVVNLVRKSNNTRAISYQALYDDACAAAAMYRELKLWRGDRLLLAIPPSKQVLAFYLAALYLGIIPMIIPEPRHVRNYEFYAQQVNDVARKTGARHVCIASEYKQELHQCIAINLFCPEQMNRVVRTSLSPISDYDDIAHLQATSGSTGTQKIAVLRHGNISENVCAIARAIHLNGGDSIVSWLPLYHDMGLICIGCMLHWQRPLVLTDASNFSRHPMNYWLKLISDYNGTISPAPASAYHICSRLAKRRYWTGIDLSSWRVAFCGAEPVDKAIIQTFHSQFSPYGLAPTTVLPVYGLAEATLAVSVPDIDLPPHLDTIDRDELETNNRALPVQTASDRVTEMVSVGSVIPNHSFRIVTAEGRPLEERHVGEIEFQGPSAIQGYWNLQTDESLHSADGFLKTGDLGYTADGRLYITGRKKEIIIIRGRNFVMHQIEAFVDELANTGIFKGVAAVGKKNGFTEVLHLLIENKKPDRNGYREQMEEKIRSGLSDMFDISTAAIHWVKKGDIPKTSSGKICRHLCKEMIQE